MVGEVSVLELRKFEPPLDGASTGLEQPLMEFGDVFAKPELVSVSSKVSSTVAISSSSPTLQLPSDFTLPFMFESENKTNALTVVLLRISIDGCKIPN